MGDTVSDYIIGRLHKWGVRRVFGYPGDGINGLMGAMQRAEGTEEHLDFVQTRHEELAAFMACAHAKFTGDVGVCMATSGPGAIHLLNGLYDAAKDHQPVVAIIGQQKSFSLGSDYQQEVDLISLFKDVAHHYVHMCTHPAQARHLIDRAMRIAKAERDVTCIIVPADVQEMDAVGTPPDTHGQVLSSTAWSEPIIVPREEDLRSAASVLNEGREVAILVGAGAKGCQEELIQVADLLGAGVAKALLGRSVLPDDLPFVTGSIGLLGTRPSDYMMQKCDTLLMIGTSFPYSEWLPDEGQARCVQIDIKPRMLGLRYPTEVALCGDSRETLRRLIPLLQRKKERSWREVIELEVRKWWELMEDRAMEPADPINPQRVFHELSPRLPERCIVAADSGSVANWWARHLKLRDGMDASLSGNLATMGCGVPYALAAKLAHPGRPVIGVIGDGAMQMIGMNGLMTIGRMWQDWDDPRLVIMVLNNQDLNQVTWEQRVMAGDPKYESSQIVPDVDYAAYAELLGLRGITMRTPDEIGPGWDAALSADRPVVINAYADPEVPPLPPHIKFEQAVKYAQAIMKGDPGAYQIIKQTLRTMFAKV